MNSARRAIAKFGPAMRTFDVIVAGSGIVGASLALALADTQLTVAVVEPSPPVSPRPEAWDSRVYTISPGNTEWLRQLGVWNRVRPDRVARVESMMVFGDALSSTLEFSAYEAGLRELALVVENRELQAALWSALAEAPHVTIYATTRC